MGSEHEIGKSYRDHVNAQSDTNVLDRGRLDLFLCI